MDFDVPSGHLYVLSFFVFWALLSILIFGAVRHGLGAESSRDERSSQQERPDGRVARYWRENDRRLGDAGAAIETKARSYFSRRIGKVHLVALACFTITTVVLAIWNMHEVKMQRSAQPHLEQPLQDGQ